MPAIQPVASPQDQRPPCPHCGKPYRTLIKRTYGLGSDGSTKQSLPRGSQWRCLACGKRYVTEGE